MSSRIPYKIRNVHPLPYLPERYGEMRVTCSDSYQPDRAILGKEIGCSRKNASMNCPKGLSIYARLVLRHMLFCWYCLERAVYILGEGILAHQPSSDR